LEFRRVLFRSVDAEELAHVEVALRGDLDVVDREAQGLRVEAEDDDLTGDQRAERVFDRARRGVVTGESGGLVDEEAVLARADLGADGSDAAPGDLVGELRGGRVASDALVPDGARVGEALRALVGGDLGDGGGPVVEKSHAATVTIRGLTAHPAA